jgi:hypothetical protein
LLRCFFCSNSWCHLPCICNSLELEPVILHGICHILAYHLPLWMVCATCCHVCLPFCTVFATFWHFNLCLHDICYMLVLQTFNAGFFKDLGFLCGFLGFHLGFL